MRLSLHIIFLTFVLMSEFSWGAPANPSLKKRPPVTSENEFDENPSPTKTEPTQINYPDNMMPDDELPTVPRLRLRRGPEDLNFHIGVSGGDILEEDDKQSTTYFGVRYIPHRTFQKAWDYTANVHLKTLVDFGVGHRWYFEGDTYFNSYYRVAINNYIDSGKGLVGILSIKQMKVIAAFGMSNLFDQQRKLTAEVAFGYGMTGYVSYLQMGYNFNF